MKKAVFLMLLLGVYSTAFGQNDLLIKKTTDMNIPGMNVGKIIADSQSSAARKSRTQTIWIKGSRLRSDSVMPTFSLLHPTSATRELSYIQQCDLGRTVHLDHKKKTYSIVKPGENRPKTEAKIARDKKGGYVDVSIQVSDTNERRDMFGFVAKHLKSTMTLTPGPGSCMKQGMSIVDDGWYVDLPTYACEIQTEDTLSSMQETDQGCADEVRVKPGANMHLGFPIQQTRTFSMNGFSFQMIETTISLERANLDVGLFEIPSDFHPDGDVDASTAAANQSTASNTVTTPTPPAPSNTQYPADWQNKGLPQMAQIGGSTGYEAKPPGVIRIGIITPTADMGQDFQGIDAGELVQQAFLDKLKAERVEAVPINSGVLIEQEAKAKQCDYLLYVDIKRKKGGGGGFLSKMILTNIACAAGNAACGAASAANGAGAAANHIKNKDEITLEFHVNKSDGSSALGSTTLKQKAQKDGDDVLSPMIADASKQILTTVHPG